MDKAKARKLLRKLSPADVTTLDGFRSFDLGVAELKKKLQENISATTLDEVNSQLKDFREKLNFTPLLSALDVIKESFTTEVADLTDQINRKVEELVNADNESDAQTEENLQKEISLLRDDLDSLFEEKNSQLKEISQSLDDIRTREKTINSRIFQLRADLGDVQDSVSANAKSFKDYKDEIGRLEKELATLRTDLISRASRGGGNANRNIAIGGNTSVLSKYTDINIKPGSNVTLTYSNNNTSKYLDLTIAATGGAGTSRSISTVSVSSVVADTASTDIVVIANAGIKLTMPTAVGNTNLYTIKNTSTSSVLVLPTGGETIDTSPNAILTVQYTAIDLISDGTNWNIT